MAKRTFMERLFPRFAANQKLLDKRIALAAHAAAELNRLTKDWKARASSADKAVIADLPALHARARDLVRNDAYAASAIRSFERNVVGTGIRAAPARKQPDGTPDSAWNTAMRELWRDWSDSPRLVDIERRCTFTDVQKWCAREVATVGEALVIENYEEREGIPGIVLQRVEAEQLASDISTYTDPEAKIARQVRGGIEVDEFGAAVAYHLRPTTYPDVGSTGAKGEVQRILASRVHHICEPGRARQTRGVGRMTCVLLKLRDLNQYDYAQLIAARAEACMGLIVTSNDPAASFGGSDGDGNKLPDQLDMLPLTTARLANGESVTTFTPQRPGGGYKDFAIQQLKAIAAGMGLSYEQLARDFTFGTYSSQRQAMLEDRREFKGLQEMLVAQLCQPVYDSFVRLVVAGGMVPGLAAGAYAQSPRSYRRARWMPDGWQWIDPEKEANADKTALDAGFTTREALMLEKGLDWREVAQALANEVAYIGSIKPQGNEQPGIAQGNEQ